MATSSRTQASIEPIELDRLLLDPLNPRLPEGLPTRKKVEAAQEELLEYFTREGVLGELASSFADNGFFATEPLIATEDGAPAGHLVVLEGNRRLAALKLLLRSPDGGKQIPGAQLSTPQKKRLDPVPVLRVKKRAEATAMIGFRHIGGLKFWDSDAKARWIKRHVDEARTAGADDPFGHIGRQVGSPTSAVRNAYLAWAAIEHVRSESGYDPGPLVAQDRFGVWLRAMESPKIRKYVGLGDARTYQEVGRALSQMRMANIEEVLNDMSPPPAGTGIVGDSRNITKYAEVIANADARKVLRKTENLARASEVLAPLTLLQMVRRAMNSLRRLRDELDRIGKPDRDAAEAIRELQNVAESLLARRPNS